MWPNSWPVRRADSGGRRLRIAAAMGGHDPELVDALAEDLLRSSQPSNEARRLSTESSIAVGADELIAGCLKRVGLAADPLTISRIRRAMSIPIDGHFQPLPGSAELLRTIRELGVRTVIASNTYWRDADSYWADFRLLGVAGYIDDIVTSVDAGHLKPHPAVFEMAMQRSGVRPDQCVVIGNREENDIEPALALGMRAILVHPDDPKPEASRAHSVAPDLWACAQAVRDMLDSE